MNDRLKCSGRDVNTNPRNFE